MMKPREYMDGLRRCAAQVERAAGEIGRAAQQGLVPDAAAFDELRSARNELERLRGELNALLGRLHPDWSDSDALTLDQLEERVDEWELRERIGAGIVGRIGDAAERLERLHAPGCGIAPAGELARQAAQALERRDMERLNELERQAAPYLDLCVLLSGDMAAAQRDGELLRRLDRWYPQVVWYVRARMRLQRDVVEFDGISDSAVNELRRSRLDPRIEQELSVDSTAHGAGPGVRDASGAGQPHAPEAASGRPGAAGSLHAGADEARPRSDADGAARRKADAPQAGPCARGNAPEQCAAGAQSRRADGGAASAHADGACERRPGDMPRHHGPADGAGLPSGGAERVRVGALGAYDELARRIRACGDTGMSAADWRALADDYPELGALKELTALEAPGSARRAQSGALVKRALDQALALDEIIEDARACLARSAGVRPVDAALARAWRELMAPGRGVLSVALETVAARRRQGYASASALCSRLMIDGLPNGLRLRRLSELVPELGGERLVELLRLLMPGLMVLGRWRALLMGEIARRMGGAQFDDDGGALRLSEQYVPVDVYRRIRGSVWRRVSPRPSAPNRQK